jgi:hypothetical protein
MGAGGPARRAAPDTYGGGVGAREDGRQPGSVRARCPAGSSSSSPSRVLEPVAELLDETLALLTGERTFDVRQGIDTHDGGHAVRHHPRRLEADGATHRMADEHDPLETEPLDHRPHVPGKGLHRPVLATQARRTVATEIEGDHPARLREVLDLRPPVGAVAGPAMNEDEGRLAAAGGFVLDGEAVR